MRSPLSAAAAFLLLARPAALAQTDAATAVTLPNGTGGIGFDDLRFSTVLGRVIVPAGRTGTLDLIDPATREVTVIGGFSARKEYGGGHGEGTTSADEGNGLLFAIDRDARELVVVDPKTKSAVARAKLAGEPDYVRWIKPSAEVWVTEPDKEEIEVFKFTPGPPPAVTRIGAVAVKGGPEALVVDAARGRAYSNHWKGTTVAIDLKSRSVVASFANGCGGSRGLALDEARALLFVGCTEGKAVALDAKSGAVLTSAPSGAGIDIIDYDPARAHLYVPGGKSATMTVFSVSEKGVLTPVGTVPTAAGAHCVVADGRGTAWVCDPKGGRLLAIADHFGAKP